MKRFSLILLTLIVLTSTAFAAPGDVVPIATNILWQCSATLNMNNASNSLLSAMNGMSPGYASKSSMNEFAIWLKIQLAQSGSMDNEFPDVIYQTLIGKVVGYGYGTPSVGANFLPPVCVLDGSNITCDEDPTGQSRDVLLFSWNYVDFTEASAGSLNTGTWTFTSLSSETNYVAAYDDWPTIGSLNTRYVTTPAP